MPPKPLSLSINWHYVYKACIFWGLGGWCPPFPQLGHDLPENSARERQTKGNKESKKKKKSVKKWASALSYPPPPPQPSKGNTLNTPILLLSTYFVPVDHIGPYKEKKNLNNIFPKVTHPSNLPWKQAYFDFPLNLYIQKAVIPADHIDRLVLVLLYFMSI